MTPTRRTSLLTLAAVPLAGIAACANMTPAQSSTVLGVINTVQGVLSGASMISPLLALVVPGAGTVITEIEKGLDVAAKSFGLITTAMSVAQTQPFVKQVGTDINAALDTADQVVTLIPNAAQRTKAQNDVNAVRASAGLLVQFATDVTALQPKAAAGPVPGGVGVNLRIRGSV